jgi:hypothetical protein
LEFLDDLIVQLVVLIDRQAIIFYPEWGKPRNHQARDQALLEKPLNRQSYTE